MDRDGFRTALERGDTSAARELLAASPELRAGINDPIGPFGARPIHLAATNPEMMDVLLDFGADINLRSDWGNGPFSVLDSAPEEAARHFIARGAKLTAHAAARLGWIDELRAMLDADPAVVHEKGGDGQRPLHFAKTPAIASLLLDRGAEVDARCIDHHSTPAQYALADRPEVCRHLLERGAMPDIFMAARLGDDDLTERLIDVDLDCLAARINAPGYAPVPPFNIYCWSIGWYLSPHEVALKFGQQKTYELMLARSSPRVRLLVACSRADQAAVERLLADDPELVEKLPPADHALLPYSLFYSRLDAARLMLAVGFDPLARGMDGFTSLHTAAWHGQAEIVSLLLRDLRYKFDLEACDNAHNSKPLSAAIHGSIHSFAKGGDHAAVVRTLLVSGAKPPEKVEGGSEAVRAVLRANAVRVDDQIPSPGTPGEG